MADSILGFMALPGSHNELWLATSLPGHIQQTTDLASGCIERTYQQWVTVESPITGAGFKVIAVRQTLEKGHKADLKSSQRIVGYKISVNVPSTTVGNNVLLVNGVPAACELAVLLLKHWLLSEGTLASIVESIDFEDFQLEEVTLTYLLDSPLNDVNSRCDAVRMAMELHNKVKVKDGYVARSRPPAFAVGSKNRSTAYLKSKEWLITCYAKHRTDVTAASFKSEEERHAVYDEGENKVRIEIKLLGNLIRQLNLTSPDSWRLYGNDAVYQKLFAVVRERIVPSVTLRSKAPSTIELSAAKLSTNDLMIVKHHLSGNVAALHHLVTGKPDKTARQKYFSDIKHRVLSRLGIDLTVPWKTQAAAVSTNIGEWFNYPGMYQPSQDLEDAIFSSQSVKQAITRLRELLPWPRWTLGSIVTDPVPKIFDLGRVNVTAEILTRLRIHRIPLHRLLSCHQAGLFGDWGLTEQLIMRERVESGKSITSFYRIRDISVTIRTQPSRIKGGENITDVSLLPSAESPNPLLYLD